MNGTPVASSTCAFDDTSCGTAGFEWMPVKNDAVSAEMSTAPASAVPIEAPRLVTRVLDAADLAALLVGHRRHRDAAELRRQRTDAQTRRAAADRSRSRVPRPTRAGPRAPRGRRRGRGNRAARPVGATRSGTPWGRPTAARSSVIDNGIRRMPVSMADRPRATDRNSGITKNIPACRRYWKKNEMSPPSQLADAQHRGVHQRRFAPVEPTVLPPQEDPAARRRRRASARSRATGRATSGHPPWAARIPNCPT